jgi:uncharacterized protein YkwD
MDIKMIQTLTLMLAITFLSACSGSLSGSAVEGALGSSSPGLGSGVGDGTDSGTDNGSASNGSQSIDGVSDGGYSYTGDCKTMNAVECAVVAAVNSERAKVGLSALNTEASCIGEAKYHAEDMAAHNYFAHDGLTETLAQRFARYGIGTNVYAGENIAAGPTDVGVVMGMWMNSAGHKANILYPNFTSMGVGIAVDSKGYPYYVQCFSSITGS